MRNILRKEKIQARNSLTPLERANFSKKISKQILLTDMYKEAQNIMLYKAVKGEVDLTDFEIAAKKDGKKLFYPCCISKTEMIALSPKDNLSSAEIIWKKGAYGIKEPVREYSIEINPEELDMVICPCTVFDESGGRMGMGAGYYDRFLIKCSKACITSVAFEIQKVQRVPMEIWDVKMDMVFTEKHLFG